jgi:hypothetical protein
MAGSGSHTGKGSGLSVTGALQFFEGHVSGPDHASFSL